MQPKRLVKDPLFVVYQRGFVDRGYRVVAAGRDWAVLHRRKRFSFPAFLVFSIWYLLYMRGPD